MKNLTHKHRGNFWGFYSTNIYLPLSAITDSVRDFSRKLRKKVDAHKQNTFLPVVRWKSFIKRKPVLLQEHEKSNGNVRLSELGVICQFARQLPTGSQILEIGTFDGRTTLNLALNAPGCCIATLDLPPKSDTRFSTEHGERLFIEKEISGRRFLENAHRYPEMVSRITQLYGDSARFDFTSYEGKCGLVFVDGSHAYDYVIKDSETAFRLLSNWGTIIWHDYGVWPGVTKALEEIEEKERAGLKHIYGTSLVFFQKRL
jgi:hypothetical protein